MTALWHAHSTSHTIVLQRVRVCHAVIWLCVQPDMCVVGGRATLAVVEFSISPLRLWLASFTYARFEGTCEL